jgi:hypothetical protein
MPAAPYPLGGEARDVVDDVRRLGGFGIVAHPDSPKPELQWREWDAPFDAIEVLNPDTSWRKRAAAAEWTTRGALLRALFTYPFRPEESVAQFLTLSDALVSRWADLLRDRPVVAIAGVDAHAKLALRDVDPGDNRLSLPFPGYEALFRTLSVHVFNDQPFTGDAPADAAILMRALRGGRLFVAADGLASPAALDFSVSAGGRSGRAGGQLALAGEPTVLVRTNAPSAYDTQLWQNGQVIASATGSLTVPAPSVPASLWVQVRTSSRPDAPVWLVSNPVYLGSRARDSATEAEPGEQALREPRRWLVDDAAIGTWTTEHDPASRASLTVTALGSGPELAFDYALAEQGAAMPFAALAVFTRGGALDGMGAVQFTARADRPMRVSVQLRAAEHQTADHRWHRSVYVDGSERPYQIPFDDFRPIGGTRIPQPLLADVHSIVFVVDTTNTRPGSSGRLALTRVGLE